MAFTPEDGTGLDGANAYISVEYADGYFSDRGVTAWDNLETEAKQAAIYRATDYVEARFGRRFRGIKLTTTQALAFPRSALYDDEGTEVEGIPDRFKQAVAEYAYRASSADLWNEPYRDPKGRIVAEKSQVGPIMEDTRYAFNRDVSEIKPVPGADRFILAYCYSLGRAVR